MYKLLPQSSNQSSDYSSSAVPKSASVSSEFLREAFFAGGSFLCLEAAYGRLYGVIKTATGYCGGALVKPSRAQVCEGGTGHTEAVKVIYDERKTTYKCLCDVFWESHDPTNKDYLNFNKSTHYRSAIFYRKEEERKKAMESKIRRQMKLERRIVTQIIQISSDFFLAENVHQKYHLQKKLRLCASLSLRSTEQFVESNMACKLNGILGMEDRSVIEKLATFVRTHELPKETRVACEEITQDMKRYLSEDLLFV